MGSATLPPWLSPWSSGLVYGQRVFQAGPQGARPRERSHHPRLTIYSYGQRNDAPVLRFSSWSEGSTWIEGSGEGSPSGAAGGAVVPGGAGLWERIPPAAGRAPWTAEEPSPLSPHSLDRPPPYDVTIHSDVEYSGPAGGAETAAALRAWSGVLRGWAAGATLLALLVLLVRMAERVLDWKILQRRRCLHREWQRANVRATSGVDGPNATELPATCAVELPPPYSACGVLPSPARTPTRGSLGLTPRAARPSKEPQCEEPPPPYYACMPASAPAPAPAHDVDVEGQRRLAPGSTRTLPPEQTTYFCDSERFTFFVPPGDRTDERAIDVNDDLGELSDDEADDETNDDAPVGPTDPNFAPNGSNSGADIAPIHIDIELSANDGLADGSAVA